MNRNNTSKSQFDTPLMLRRLKEGDELAFAEIVYHLSPDLMIKAYKFTKSKGDAEDLVQDIFTELWEKRGKLTYIESLPSYLYVCLKHKFLRKVMRSNLDAKAMDYLGNRLGQMQSTVVELMEASEVQATISKVVNSLPQHMQNIFHLRGEDHSIREIAQALGLAEQTVKTYNMQLKQRVKEVVLTNHPDLSYSFSIVILMILSTF